MNLPEKVKEKGCNHLISHYHDSRHTTIPVVDSEDPRGASPMALGDFFTLLLDKYAISAYLSVSINELKEVVK